ncbi:DUF981 family protein [Nocardioides terrisoli]|uniref:DUF981 family protein n=1 Tax=Nocardioides terrisoli TaxID=3388267 RepID=UPI00287BB7C6|nr:DUF981 family protein [Nocardioides marmorisolisilvae]
MDFMPLNNTIVGLAAGIGLIGIARIVWKLQVSPSVPDETWVEGFSAEGWALVFAPAGFILTAMGLAITIGWPYRIPAVFDANILFGEPALGFGALLLAAAFYLWKERGIVSRARLWRTLTPVSLYIFALGLMMGACAISWWRYELGAAPPTEPISGTIVGGHPLIESIPLFVLYGLVALGALLFPLLTAGRASGRNAGWLTPQRQATIGTIIYWTWLIAGVVFMLFSALNYYTHIGSLQNDNMHTHYKW